MMTHWPNLAFHLFLLLRGLPRWLSGKESVYQCRRHVRIQSLGWEDPLEEGMATHSSILAWRIPLVRGAWWATVHGVTKSQTQRID